LLTRGGLQREAHFVTRFTPFISEFGYKRRGPFDARGPSTALTQGTVGMNAQGSIIRYITPMVILGLAVLAAATFHSARKKIGQDLPADAMTAAYFEQHSEPDCRFAGAWQDWERDEWMTLGCLKVKVEHREGSYSFATGPRATLQVSMQGTYWIDGAGILHVARQDSEGKNHNFSVPISVENAELPTQICFAETTEGIACTAFFIWKKDE
jgi:hypothetical protein